MQGWGPVSNPGDPYVTPGPVRNPAQGLAWGEAQGLAQVEDNICSSYALTEEGEQLFSARDGAQFIFSMFHLMIVLLCVLARAFQESLSSLMDSVSAAAIDHGGFRQRLVNQEDV